MQFNNDRQQIKLTVMVMHTRHIHTAEYKKGLRKNFIDVKVMKAKYGEKKKSSKSNAQTRYNHKLSYFTINNSND